MYVAVKSNEAFLVFGIQYHARCLSPQRHTIQQEHPHQNAKRIAQSHKFSKAAKTTTTITTTTTTASTKQNDIIKKKPSDKR